MSEQPTDPGAVVDEVRQLRKAVEELQRRVTPPPSTYDGRNWTPPKAAVEAMTDVSYCGRQISPLHARVLLRAARPHLEEKA